MLPVDPQARASTISWLFAAFNSIEPAVFELGNVDLFADGREWAKLRRPSLIEFLGGRLDRLADALGDKSYLVVDFTVADIAMTTVLRETTRSGVLATRPTLAAYLDRNLERPAFKKALADQLAVFERNAPPNG